MLGKNCSSVCWFVYNNRFQVLKHKTVDFFLPFVVVIWSVQLYSKELEAQFGPFDDWVSTYELFRGKANEEEGTSDERFVGKFKVSSTTGAAARHGLKYMLIYFFILLI